MKVVRERLGHATAGFAIARYQTLLPNMQADAARQLDDLADGAN